MQLSVIAILLWCPNCQATGAAGGTAPTWNANGWSVPVFSNGGRNIVNSQPASWTKSNFANEDIGASGPYTGIKFKCNCQDNAHGITDNTPSGTHNWQFGRTFMCHSGCNGAIHETGRPTESGFPYTSSSVIEMKINFFNKFEYWIDGVRVWTSPIGVDPQKKYKYAISWHDADAQADDIALIDVEAILCKCPNGVARTAPDCTTDQATECSICNPGYSGTTCQATGAPTWDINGWSVPVFSNGGRDISVSQAASFTRSNFANEDIGASANYTGIKFKCNCQRTAQGITEQSPSRTRNSQFDRTFMCQPGCNGQILETGRPTESGFPYTSSSVIEMKINFFNKFEYWIDGVRIWTSPIGVDPQKKYKYAISWHDANAQVDDIELIAVEAIVCKCPNGVARTAPHCTTDQATECSSCNPGYSGTTCQATGGPTWDINGWSVPIFSNGGRDISVSQAASWTRSNFANEDVGASANYTGIKFKCNCQRTAQGFTDKSPSRTRDWQFGRTFMCQPGCNGQILETGRPTESGFPYTSSSVIEMKISFFNKFEYWIDGVRIWTSPIGVDPQKKYKYAISWHDANAQVDDIELIAVEAIVCKCPNGVARTAPHCTTDQATECSSCNPGYSGTTCQATGGPTWDINGWSVPIFSNGGRDISVSQAASWTRSNFANEDIGASANYTGVKFKCNCQRTAQGITDKAPSRTRDWQFGRTFMCQPGCNGQILETGRPTESGFPYTSSSVIEMKSNFFNKFEYWIDGVRVWTSPIGVDPQKEYKYAISWHDANAQVDDIELIAVEAIVCKCPNGVARTAPHCTTDQATECSSCNPGYSGTTCQATGGPTWDINGWSVPIFSNGGRNISVSQAASWTRSNFANEDIGSSGPYTGIKFKCNCQRTAHGITDKAPSRTRDWQFGRTFMCQPGCNGQILETGRPTESGFPYTSSSVIEMKINFFNKFEYWIDGIRVWTSPIGVDPQKVYKYAISWHDANAQVDDIELIAVEAIVCKCPNGVARTAPHCTTDQATECSSCNPGYSGTTCQSTGGPTWDINGWSVPIFSNGGRDISVSQAASWTRSNFANEDIGSSGPYIGIKFKCNCQRTAHGITDKAPSRTRDWQFGRTFMCQPGCNGQILETGRPTESGFPYTSSSVIEMKINLFNKVEYWIDGVRVWTSHFGVDPQKHYKYAVSWHDANAQVDDIEVTAVEVCETYICPTGFRTQNPASRNFTEDNCCKIIVCKCANGVARTTPNCTTDQATECSSCNPGYSGTTCQAATEPPTTTSGTTVPPEEVVVEGSFTLEMDNAEEFVEEAASNPEVTTVLRSAIAEMAECNESWVQDIRVLLVEEEVKEEEDEEETRRLATARHAADLSLSTRAGVKVDFDIVMPPVPPGSGVTAEVTATILLETFDQKSVEEATKVVQAAIDSGQLTGDYDVKVSYKIIKKKEKTTTGEAPAAKEEDAGQTIVLVIAIAACVTVMITFLALATMIRRSIKRRRKQQDILLNASLKKNMERSYNLQTTEGFLREAGLLANASLMDLLHPSEPISSQQQHNVMQLLRAILDMDDVYNAEVYVSYALDDHLGDWEGAGRGLFHAASVMRVLKEIGVHSFLTLEREETLRGTVLDMLRTPGTACKALVVLETFALYSSRRCLEEVHVALQLNIPVLRLRLEEGVEQRDHPWEVVDPDDPKVQMMATLVGQTFGLLPTVPPRPETIQLQASALYELAQTIKDSDKSALAAKQAADVPQILGKSTQESAKALKLESITSDQNSNVIDIDLEGAILRHSVDIPAKIYTKAKSEPIKSTKTRRSNDTEKRWKKAGSESASAGDNDDFRKHPSEGVGSSKHRSKGGSKDTVRSNTRSGREKGLSSSRRAHSDSHATMKKGTPSALSSPRPAQVASLEDRMMETTQTERLGSKYKTPRDKKEKKSASCA